MDRNGYSLFWPVLIISVALVLWTAFQTSQLVKEREALAQARANQQPLVDNAAKLRNQLDSLAAETQKLANGGNPNAKLLVDELRKRGVTINPDAPRPGAPAAKK